MCSLCGGEGSVGTCLPLASLSRRPPGFCRHPWRVCGPRLAWQVTACAPRREETAGVSQPGGCWGLGLWPLREGAYPPSPGVAAVPEVLNVAPEPLVLPCALGGPSHPFPMSSSGGRHGETRPAASSLDLSLPCPWRGLDPSTCHLGQACDSPHCVLQNLGKAWRQGTGPIGLSSLPNWSVPSLLPCFLPGAACWNPDRLPPSWWCPLTVPVQRNGGMGQDLGPSVSDVPSGPASAWKGFLSLVQGALTFLEWNPGAESCPSERQGGPGEWGTMGRLRSASWPGLGPGFGGVLGTRGHWPALPEPSSINGSPWTPRGLDPRPCLSPG
ncbi:unnamed protein product [Rangifer tarandus platyrhynchus]|uniref:Uncharacterized protein n=1 Tax=Rangifer tarandus platyrhynchus TaxID=3082113 RepID=A0AC60A852_RANTA